MGRRAGDRGCHLVRQAGHATGYGIAVFDVDPSHAEGQTSITVTRYQALGADPVNPNTGAKGAPTGDYTVFETLILVRPSAVHRFDWPAARRLLAGASGLLAQRGPGNEHLLSCLGEGARVGERHEVPQMPRLRARRLLRARLSSRLAEPASDRLRLFPVTRSGTRLRYTSHPAGHAP
jgi:hypothetical protein